jgi:transcriptional regulator with XRE-family HTH domain
MKVGSIGEYIRQQREQAKISMRQLASAAGVSNPYLSQIERGLRRPSAEILQQIAKGLRISAEALYVQAGILEDRQSESGVRTAVLADPGLSERQKQVLLEIYESFRKEMAASEEDAEAAEGSELGDLATDGPAADGQALDGAPDGSTPDGSTPDGAALGGTALRGAALNGAAHANAWADAVEPDAAGPDPAE